MRDESWENGQCQRLEKQTQFDQGNLSLRSNVDEKENLKGAWTRTKEVTQSSIEATLPLFSSTMYVVKLSNVDDFICTT